MLCKCTKDILELQLFFKTEIFGRPDSVKEYLADSGDFAQIIPLSYHMSMWYEAV
jgi:hypothetical protein